MAKKARSSPGMSAETAAEAAAGKALSAALSGKAGREFLNRIAAAIAASPASVAPLQAIAAASAFGLGRAATLDDISTKVAAAVSSLASLVPLPVTFSVAMDPRLQLAVANRMAGKPGLTMAATTSEEVAVIARVSSPQAWIAHPDVLPGSVLGETDDLSWLVTGRVPLDRVEAVRLDPAVLSLKASQPMRPALAFTNEAMATAESLLPAGVDPKGGKGVVVGIVDFGCDIMHGNFRLANGKTRLLALWHQAGIMRPGSPFGYGRLHTRAEIDAAIRTIDPYAALEYGPPQDDDPASRGSHGTHVTDIAAGNGRGSGQPGVAPQADIIFVEASSSDIAWQGPDSAKQFFGDSVQLVEAVRFIFDTAGDRPCVVNLSLGTNGGPHDGRSLVEQGLDALVREKPNRAVVIAASNSQEHGIHTAGTVAGAAAHDIAWRQRNAGGGEVEIWYPGDRRLEVTLVAEDGTSFGPVAPGETLPIGGAGQIVIFLSSRLDDPNNRDNAIGIWLGGNLPGIDWTIRLRSLDGQDVAYHAWIERNDGAQASFANAVPTHTLGSISTGQSTIVVGSYDAHKPGFPLSGFSSSGPTRDGREKPEISAPGHQVVAARSLTGSGVVRKSGTSMAAPAVTGLIALILAEAKRKGQDLDIDALRARIAAGALADLPAFAAAPGWHPRYGKGRATAASV